MTMTSMAAAQTLKWEGDTGEDEPLTVKIRRRVLNIEHEGYLNLF